MTAAALVPELCVRDVGRASTLLCDVFGYAATGAADRLTLGPHPLRLRHAETDGRPGAIDHLALRVPDLAPALAAALARGGRIDRDVTPGGPRHIAEFWQDGIDYVFLEGPEAARIELCARRRADTAALPRHDHIGIPCTDLAAMRGWFLSLGLVEVAATVLARADGDVPVSFLGLGHGDGPLLELYAPAGPVAAPSGTAAWRLCLIGADEDADRIGPEGFALALRRA